MAKPKFAEGEHPMDIKVKWAKTDDSEFPYTSEVNGQAWVIRVNDWPEDPTDFTLLVDGAERGCLS